MIEPPLIRLISEYDVECMVRMKDATDKEYILEIMIMDGAKCIVPIPLTIPHQQFIESVRRGSYLTIMEGLAKTIKGMTDI